MEEEEKPVEVMTGQQKNESANGAAGDGLSPASLQPHLWGGGGGQSVCSSSSGYSPSSFVSIMPRPSPRRNPFGPVGRPHSAEVSCWKWVIVLMYVWSEFLP